MSLEKLSQLNSVSGNESQIRDYIIQQIKPHTEDIKVDKIGNIIAYKKGRDTENKTMISAHMDEVGLMINSINSEGLLGFTLVGDIDNRILMSKPVTVGEKNIAGVIGAKPIHLQKRDERKKILDYSELYIDIGTSSKEESEKLVAIGDYACFQSDYIEFGEGLIKARSLDNKSGCKILIDLLKKDSDISFYAVFSVMKEIGIYGGYPASYSIKPDINIVLDSALGQNKLGDGPILSFMEKGAYFDNQLTKNLIDIAQDTKTPFQLSGCNDYNSDAHKIQTSGGGSKTIKISIPCRYRRSPVNVISKADLNNTSILLELFFKYIGGN